MLLKFRVANVRSFREERELAFAVPTGKTAHASRQVRWPAAAAWTSTR